MATQNYTDRETRYFIGRISKGNVKETLRMENYNDLPSAIRDDFDFGRGFKDARIANLGVQFFESYEENKGEGRNYWYFLQSVTVVNNVAMTEKTNPVIKNYFNNLSNPPKEEEEPTEEPAE